MDEELKKVTEEIGKLAAFITENREKITKIENASKHVPGDIKDAEDRMVKAIVPKLLESQEIAGLIKSADETRTLIERMSAHNIEKGLEPTEHRKAFIDWMQNGEKMSTESREFFDSDSFKKELRTLNETTDWEGGVFVDPQTSAELIKTANDMSPFWNVARTITISTGNDISFRKRTSIPTMYRSGESGTGTKTNQEYGKETIIAYPADVYVQASRDLLADVSLMESFIRDDAAEAFAVGLGTEYISGSGGDGAQGIEEATVSSFTGADAANDLIDPDDFYTCLTTLNPKYRGNGTYLMNSTVLGKVLKFQSTTGSYIWQPDLASGPMGKIAGKNFAIMEDLPDDGTDGNYPLWFGDFNQMYYILHRAQIEVTRDPYTSKPDVEFLFRMRTGGRVVLAEAAVKVLV